MLADLALAKGLSDLKARIAIRAFYMRCTMLRDAGFAHFDTLLVFMLKPAYDETEHDTATHLASPYPALVTAQCASTMGFEFRRLMGALEARDLAVGAMLRKHEALRRASRKLPWFRPLLEVCACALVRKRACVCACVRAFARVRVFARVGVRALWVLVRVVQPAVRARVRACVLAPERVCACVAKHACGWACSAMCGGSMAAAD